MNLVTKSKGIKGYKSVSKERLLSALSESKSVEGKNCFNDERLKKIRKDLNEIIDSFRSLKEKRLEKISMTWKPKNIFYTKNKRNWRKYF